jgi:hypothetical protein
LKTCESIRNTVKILGDEAGVTKIYGALIEDSNPGNGRTMSCSEWTDVPLIKLG